MRITQHALAAVAAALIAFPVAASAQTPATAPAAAPTLVTGKWTGIVTPPDGPTEVAYNVATVNDTVQITLDAGEHGQFKFENIKLAGESLSFDFTPGPKVVCVLAKKEDGSYAGDCTADDGTPVPMTMVPPKKEAGTGN